MLTKNYIILASGYPSQLKRLITRLDDGYSFFYIHIDKKADIKNFQQALNSLNVVFIKKRVNCIWGDFSLVQATLNCMESLIEDNRSNYTILLSESCYPIMSNLAINQYLEKNYDAEHIDILPIEQIWKNWKQRIGDYKINFSSNRGDYKLYPYFFKNKPVNIAKDTGEIIKLSLARKTMKFLPQYFSTLKKRQLNGVAHYGGSAWWAFSFSTLKKVMKFIDNNPSLISFHKKTVLPDEIFFHTIIHQLSLTENLDIRPSLTYTDWTRPGVELPVTFTSPDLPELLLQSQSGKLFARKFSPMYSGEVLNQLDELATGAIKNIS